jgi:hypothetical protein
MTITEEILICANQLANAGKKPSVALVKAKLSQRAPLATLITTLKNWQHQPKFITPTFKEDNQLTQDMPTDNTSQLIQSLLEKSIVKKIIQQSIEEELTMMKKELSEMKLLINNLTEQLHKHNK